MVEEKDIRKITMGIIILIITGLFSGCAEQSQNLNNNSSSNNSSVLENQPPLASCSANKTFGYVPLFVSFIGSGTDTDGMIISYYWDFGDGNTSVEQNPKHLYDKAGTYTVILTASDDDGASDNDTIEITVLSTQNNLPTADFTYSPSSPSDSNVIQFTDKSTDSDGSIISWLWDFGDGDSSTGKNPNHQYVNSGSYEVKLTVKDNDDSASETTKEIIINEQSKEFNNEQSNDDAILTITYNGEHKTYGFSNWIWGTIKLGWFNYGSI
jgi:PKD repeat protein